MIKLLPTRRPHPGNTLRTVVLACAAMMVFNACDSAVDAHEEDPEEEIDRSYTKTIERNYANEFERALIDSAEAAYPPRDSVIAILDIAYPSRDNESLIPKEGYWHRASFDGVLLPYSITIDALEYYSTLIDSMESEATHQYIKSADLVYRAEITFKDDYKFSWPPLGEAYGPELPVPQEEDFIRVFVVHTTLNWHHILIDPSGMRVIHERIVVFDEHGKLKRIFLDGIWPVTAN